MKDNPRWWADTLMYYGMYKKGHLPDDGPVTMQSHLALSVFDLLDRVNHEVDEEVAQREQIQRNRLNKPRKQR